MDLTVFITPLCIAPSLQNGYGSEINQLAQPDDVELLPDGSMIVSDVNNNRIQYFSPSGEFLRSITARDLGWDAGQIIPTGLTQDDEGFI